ncbi:MAG: hypothetical protein IPL03_09810 [Sterolibacteriaceae bacterium]|nr:hypothetical protein [Candidatus Methylophosphatis haderslevensis]
MWDGKIASVFVFAVLASALAGRIVAARYRKRVLAFMSQGTPPAGDGGAPAPPQRAARAARASSIAANRGARRRLALAIVAISLAIGLSQSWWSLQFVYNETGYGPIKLSLIGAAYAWVMVPALGLLWRWHWLRIALTSAAYMAAFGLLMYLRSTGAQSLVSMALWLGGTIAVPLIAFGLAASGRARATGPYLLPLFLILGGASIAGTDLLGQLIERPSALQWIVHLGASHVTVFAAFALAPWLILAWPAWRLARALARGYQAKLYSEPLYLMGSYWLVALLVTALPASHGIGAASLTVIACWLWLPLGVWLARGWLAPPPDPPNLLVLRVFRRDSEVQALFDSVIERWRASGTVSLIAGTDLALNTLEPDELFAYLNGRLRERFIAGPDDLTRQLAAIDALPDPDGRYRVADFYCFDSTWKLALAALVARADVVLMDLRGLVADNRGCLHELGVLALAAHLQRVVLLFDRHTDRAAAQAATGADSQRFLWFDANRPDNASAEAVLANLLDAPRT